MVDKRCKLLHNFCEAACLAGGHYLGWEHAGRLAGEAGKERATGKWPSEAIIS